MATLTKDQSQALLRKLRAKQENQVRNKSVEIFKSGFCPSLVEVGVILEDFSIDRY